MGYNFVYYMGLGIFCAYNNLKTENLIIVNGELQWLLYFVLWGDNFFNVYMDQYQILSLECILDRCPLSAISYIHDIHMYSLSLDYNWHGCTKLFPFLLKKKKQWFTKIFLRTEFQ